MIAYKQSIIIYKFLFYYQYENGDKIYFLNNIKMYQHLISGTKSPKIQHSQGKLSNLKYIPQKHFPEFLLELNLKKLIVLYSYQLLIDVLFLSSIFFPLFFFQLSNYSFLQWNCVIHDFQLSLYFYLLACEMLQLYHFNLSFLTK